jgi:protein-disulfide isomerase
MVIMLQSPYLSLYKIPMDKPTVPIAIIVAGLIVGGAIFLNKSGGGQEAAVGAIPEERTAADAFKPVTADDHILGNPNAPIVFVEYSDTECPFCKNFHATMHRVIDTYGKEGQVAWVYRHFPLASLHSKAPKEAEATECAAELGGNDGFWQYVDRLYEITPSNDGLDLSQLPNIAEEVGLDRNAFTECLNSGRHAEKVQASFNDALAVGGTGTPHTLFVVGDTIIPLNGAQPFEAVAEGIDAALAQIAAEGA